MTGKTENSATPSSSPSSSTPHVFRPSRQHVLALILMTGIALIGIGWAPLKLGWLLIVPLGLLAWVLTTSTTVSESGIAIKYLIKPNRTIPWENFAGIAFTGSRALAETSDGARHVLPGVTFNSLPELSAASNGRITDVITQAEKAADGKYEIIDREGRKVLLNREEYDAYVREHPDLPGPRPQVTP